MGLDKHWQSSWLRLWINQVLALSRLDCLACIVLCDGLLVYELYASALPGVTTSCISCGVESLLWCILSNDSQPVKCSLIACIVLLIIGLYINWDHTALSLAFVLHKRRSLRLSLTFIIWWWSTLALLSITTKLRFYDVLELAGIRACHLELLLNRCHRQLITLIELQLDLLQSELGHNYDATSRTRFAWCFLCMLFRVNDAGKVILE